MTHNKRNNSYLMKKGLYCGDYAIYSHKRTKQFYPTSLSSHKYVTHFDNLPDEILLIIFHYLSPIDVLKSFYGYNNRLFQCITYCRENIDLSKLSYRLNTLELAVNEGIILDKQLSPNQYLKRVTINLQTIDDLLIIFYGFLPNLIFLNVIISHKHSNY
ncbi:hypothetical protein I4U23_011360 [Adineta vaga]|nr:hypothetical protein I4U23_011360 [Adineta vaga]